jgi:hypothetical protein
MRGLRHQFQSFREGRNAQEIQDSCLEDVTPAARTRHVGDVARHGWLQTVTGLCHDVAYWRRDVLGLGLEPVHYCLSVSSYAWFCEAAS